MKREYMEDRFCKIVRRNDCIVWYRLMVKKYLRVPIFIIWINLSSRWWNRGTFDS